MIFHRDALELEAAPGPPSSLRPGQRLTPDSVLEVRLDRAPPELVLATGEVLFVAATQRHALDLFARVNHLRRARRIDVWADLAEPFLDTEFGADTQAMTMERLARCGLDGPEVAALRAKLESPMLAYTALTWEWVHYGHWDVLAVMRGALSASDFESFYWRSMELANRGAEVPPYEIPLADRLRWKWGDMCRDLGIPFSRGEAELSRVTAAYGAPERRYHDLAHVRHVVDLSLMLAASLPERNAVAAAAWFHDAVYVAGDPENEARSAELMRELLLPLGAKPEVVERAATLIMRTRAPLSPVDAAERALVDADLSILGEEPSVYDAYARAIREEFFAIDDDAFRHGRAAFLDKLMAHRRAQGRLFHGLHPLHEALAVENLERERAAL